MPSRLRIIIGCRSNSVEDEVVDAMASSASESAAGDSMVEGDVIAEGDVVAAGRMRLQQLVQATAWSRAMSLQLEQL